MNAHALRIYREARRAMVTAATAYRIAEQESAPRAYAFGAYPSDGDSIERDGITYTLELQHDDLSIVDMLPDAIQYSSPDDLPDGAIVLRECDRRHFGYYYSAETWAEFWPTETVSSARQYLADRMVSNLSDLFEYGSVWIRIVATDAETEEELADESIGGFDDSAYGAEEVFRQCEHAAKRERIAAADYVSRL